MVRTARQEAGFQKRQVTQANNKQWIAENPEASLAQQNALCPPAPPARETNINDLAPTLAFATEFEATSSGAESTLRKNEHVLEMARGVAFFESFVSDLSKRPREGEGEAGASSKKACTDTSRAVAAASPASELPNVDLAGQLALKHEELARLQHDFDMSGAFHTGQMERKDKTHDRDNVRKDGERQALIARAEGERDVALAERDAALAAARAATNRAERAEAKEAQDNARKEKEAAAAMIADAKKEAAARRVEVILIED